MRGYSLVLAAIVALLAGSASPAQEHDSAPSKPDKSVYAELAKAPEKARSRPNPFANDPDSIPAGRILFRRHCAECHGESAEGGKKAPSLRAAEVQNAEPGAIFWILTNGVVRRGMPVWSKLPEPQRWQLVTFLKSLGVAPARPTVSAPNQPTLPSKDSPSPRR